MLGYTFRNCRSINLSVEKLHPSNKQCDIVTIAFNNVNTIRRQIRLIRKYIRDEYDYIVADNSSDATVRHAIEDLCVKNGVSYISLPKNYLTTIIGGSYSHGVSLNWIYCHIIKKRQPRYFGFIDHDLFPVKAVSPVQKLANQPVYGHAGQQQNYWYLWAGLCFYQFDFVKDKKVDFLPAKPCGTYLDTGGGNWYSIYSQIDKSNLTLEVQQIRNYGEEDNQNSWKESSIQYIGDCWLHTISGSNLEMSKEIVDIKEQIIEQAIKEIEQKSIKIQ
jgi:glycosyltransferase involved in cell wall biosynthesis